MQTSWIRGAVAFMLLGPEADAAHAPADAVASVRPIVEDVVVTAEENMIFKLPRGLEPASA